ncbi:condensin-2 complex subunit H2 isoform X1 [Podarcis raffonei]|uniref:condensin-2 complex subunit H2 isoform X1 n=1 Tax=Podarcis raffonei TaxID=65483 RepID=UPI0023294B36|nr:condensin-2 complex subunit H2 isoform X1 [Podarcis raffonei]XP_053260820.1 condensin-2 complex subunit H2 isoform X1 [Podarcis raffonei]
MGFAAMEDVESRFVHFLKPIRDLTANWAVDVAAQLGEYLEELAQICISFDNGRTTMNFTEAAMLIQGSACIYSKKVESLYSLVFQALDFISNKKREKQAASVGEDGVDRDVSNGPAAEEEKFLSLDDIRDTSRASNDMRGNQKHSANDIVPLTPMALVPPDDAEKTDNPLFSQKGEKLASRKDFHMNICTPQITGRLELVGLSPIQDRNWDRGIGSIGVQGLLPAGSTPMDVCGFRTPVAALNFSEESAGAAAPICDDNDDCDNFLPALPEDVLDGSPAGEEEVHVEHQMSIPQRKGYMLRERSPAPDACVKEMLDPWRSLDPFSSSDDKPLRKGKPFTVPHALENLPGTKRKRRLPSKLQEFTAWFSATEHHRAGNQRSRKKGPVFPDLEVLYLNHAKERLAAQKKLQRMRLQDAQLANRLEEPEALEEEEEQDVNDAMGDMDVGGADDFLEHEDAPQGEAAEEAPVGLIDLGDITPAINYEEYVQRNVEVFISHSQKYARETVLSRRVRDWEEMVVPKLEEQESHEALDIHSYGDMLVSKLGTVGEWHSFASLVTGQPPFEVCRCLLASLQLANDYTVEISQKPGLEEGMDTMALRLLTQNKAHDRFRTYTAPSLGQH